MSCCLIQCLVIYVTVADVILTLLQERYGRTVIHLNGADSPRALVDVDEAACFVRLVTLVIGTPHIHSNEYRR